MAINWNIKRFEDLSNEELYSILQLRCEVFSVEQNCAYQDLDGKDLKSFHISGVDETNELVAYSRIIPAGVSYDEVSIGRVVTSQKVRGTGIGKELMETTLHFIQQQFGSKSVRISAQSYLIKFYSDFGFKTHAAEYLEDNIPHIEMIKN